MPVPAQRDPDLTRDILAEWLGDPARLPGARITDLQTPEFSGFSSETLMVDVECGEAAAALAVRVAPLHYKVFPETRFAEEYRLMRILDSDTDIPVPPVLWYEPDPGYLGAPFLVMRRIEGRVPTDMPPYHRSWGIRPVGEPEPPGIQSRGGGTFYWLYAPVQFEDHAILCIVQEDGAGRRLVEEAARVWPDGTSEYLGRPLYRRRTPRAPGTW